MLIRGGDGGGGQRRVGHAEALMLAAQHVEAHLMAYAARRQRHGRDGRVRHLALVVVMVMMLMMVRRRVNLLMLLLLLLNKLLLLRLLCGSIFHTRGLLLLLLLLLMMKMAARVVVVVVAVGRAHHWLEVEVGHMLAVDGMRGRQVACRCHTRRVAGRKTLLLRLLLLLWLIAIV